MSQATSAKNQRKWKRIPVPNTQGIWRIYLKYLCSYPKLPKCRYIIRLHIQLESKQVLRKGLHRSNRTLGMGWKNPRSYFRNGVGFLGKNIKNKQSCPFLWWRNYSWLYDQEVLFGFLGIDSLGLDSPFWTTYEVLDILDSFQGRNFFTLVGLLLGANSLWLVVGGCLVHSNQKLQHLMLSCMNNTQSTKTRWISTPNYQQGILN